MLEAEKAIAEARGVTKLTRLAAVFSMNVQQINLRRPGYLMGGRHLGRDRHHDVVVLPVRHAEPLAQLAEAMCRAFRDVRHIQRK